MLRRYGLLVPARGFAMSLVFGIGIGIGIPDGFFFSCSFCT
jgi:hypothetical protein